MASDTALKPQLHHWQIDPREYARHESRRGRRFAYEQINPQQTALVVIDMVAFFVAENAYCQEIIPHINLLANTVREKGGVVAWVLPEVKPPTPWMSKFYGARVASSYAASGGDGLLVDRLYAELNALPEDIWVEKSASSAFFLIGVGYLIC